MYQNSETALKDKWNSVFEKILQQFKKKFKNESLTSNDDALINAGEKSIRIE